MAQVAKSKKADSRPSAQKAFIRNGPNWPLFVLALIGMVLSIYLTYAAWEEKLVAGCNAGSACDIVLSSRWATLFGMPTSFWGFLTYALLAAVAWNKRADNQWKVAWIISLFAFIYSLYLTSISLFDLRAACPYCLTSLGLLTVIFLTVTIQRPANLPGFSWGPWLGKSVGGALILVLAVHFHYAGYLGTSEAPEDPWIRGLAEHLSTVDAKFYGASWCPHCAEQKEMFGSSNKRLPYVECSPGGGDAPQAPICKEKDIKSYPTWIINGERYTGTQSLEQLAQYTHYQAQEGKP
jgi:uncharacterized membrane protein/glutaredoxin